MKFLSVASLSVISLCITMPLTLAQAAPATALSSLAEIEQALDQGASVAVSLDLSRCQPDGATTRAGKAKGGLTINGYLVMDGVLSFSDSHPTVGKNREPLWQFLRYQVKPDKTVIFTADMFQLPAYTRLGERISYKCGMNEGIRFIRQ
ncbi:VirK family protein [Robbsia andropogonis]|uniref:VirK family protein n=1 Tax=Robbsia andropogonis TaxID=28092 RepID=UPI000465A6F5|nr:VirK family protein [Robbsia andropogonis]